MKRISISKRRIRIRDALIEYGKELERKKSYPLFTNNLKADDLVRNNAFAFLIAVLMDHGMKAEKAWEMPFELKLRLGHLNTKKIAIIKEERLIELFNKTPKLHRFPNVMALRVKKACCLLMEKYEGMAENLWGDCLSAKVLQDRFREFEGIGQKKASMGVNMLVRDLGIKLKDKSGLDVSYDVHVRRVFVRTGLVRKDSMDLIVETARRLYPEYPGILDYPSWVIGREYCYQRKPRCEECKICE